MHAYRTRWKSHVAILLPGLLGACSSSGGGGAVADGGRDAATESSVDATSSSDATSGLDATSAPDVPGSDATSVDATTPPADSAGGPEDAGSDGDAAVVDGASDAMPAGDGGTAFGGACSQGSDCASGYCNPATQTCDAETLATGQTHTVAIAVDPANLYWTMADDAGATGTVMKLSLSPGAQPVPLASSGGLPLALAIDGTNAYWSSSWYTISRVPLEGGAATPISSSVLADGIALDDASVYFPNYDDNSIWRAPKGGGGPVALVPAGMDGGQGANAIAVDGTSVYWANRTNGNVSRVSLDGGGAGVFVAGGAFGSALTIAVDIANVYWGTGSNLEKAPLDGGAAGPLATAGECFQLAVDSTYVYWVDGISNVSKVPLGGGPLTVLAGGQRSPWGIAIDANYVYFANNGDGTIKRVHK